MQRKRRLVDVVRERLRVKHYSYRTEQAYLGWIRRFIGHHGGRHPREMSGPEVQAFLNHLATERNVAASTQNQALEVARVLANLEGVHALIGGLLYGAGLRVTECLRLRVKDIDFGYGEITVRDGKGNKDRRTVLPQSLEGPLRHQLKRVKLLHEKDLEENQPGVSLPYTGLTIRHHVATSAAYPACP